MSHKNEIDARGLSCPQPVVMAQKAIQAASTGDVIEVLVDNPAARENVSRFATSRGCKVETRVLADADADIDADEDCYVVKITAGDRR